MYATLVIAGKVLLAGSLLSGVAYYSWPTSDSPPSHRRYIVMCAERWYYVNDFGGDPHFYLFSDRKHDLIVRRRDDTVLLDTQTRTTVIGSNVSRWWPECDEALQAYGSVHGAIRSNARDKPPGDDG